MTPSLLEHYQSFARYNAWANRRIYAACEELPEAEYQKPRRAFFKTIHNTLNHLVLVDRLYTARIFGRPHGFTALDEELYADFASLEAARVEEDKAILSLVDDLKAERLAATVTYRTIKGERERSDRVADILTMLFNHQTHHRGQVHDMLSQTEIAPPSLDYIYFISEV